MAAIMSYINVLKKKWLSRGVMVKYHPLLDNNLDGLVQSCSNSSALAIELLQSCVKPPILCIML